MRPPPEQRSAVYTALFGDYERLNETQNVGSGDTPFLCFTDDPGLTSSVWEIRVVKPLFPDDLQRSQRELKIRGCPELDGFDRTLYIDNAVSLTAPPELILDAWLAAHDLAIPAHSFRASVLDEFFAVLSLGLDDPARVREQLDHYAESSRTVLDEAPTWNGMIARRNSPDVRDLMNRWFDEVLRYSRRDQLSSNVIFGRAAVAINRIAIDNHRSEFHSWGSELGRRRPEVAVPPGHTIPDIARIRELENELAEERRATAARDAELRATRTWRIVTTISQTAGKLKLARPRGSDH